ncbi:aminotransferase class IV [Alteromonas halophila]|uniref:Aminodeoxychorismate lyase n=1 Tax=Alteromonas halophila TaxID=516698 RepID=A0A918N090_9ALTE|nr:aminotransferase class IV [Alteromonas halophila]GGW88912.1 cytochrome c550 [Alteromonas halophila]
MTIAYLNGEYLPLEDARISPLDRGFLYGDGIYEVIPTYNGRFVGFNAHMARMRAGLDALQIRDGLTADVWKTILDRLISENKQQMPDANIGLYLHVSRGADIRRHHAFPEGIPPTVFAYAFPFPAPQPETRAEAVGLQVDLAEDLRWQRCNIKSTSLLGNIMHYQQGHQRGLQETLLYNRDGEITEASSSNVFVVKNKQIMTPPLDHQLLSGITRMLLIESLASQGVEVLQQPISREALLAADEVWLTSSSKEVAPVTEVGGKTIGKGDVGACWQMAIQAYHTNKFIL